MDLPQLIAAAPNLAFGIICLWFVREIQRERVAEGARYAGSLEKINELYIQLLEKAVTAIASNATISAGNRDTLSKLTAEVGGLRNAIERNLRDSKRGESDRSRASGRSTTDQ